MECGLMANTLLINGTDLTRYDREIMVADWGSMLSGIEYRGDDVILPGMPGEVYAGRVAGSRVVPVVIELTGMSGAGTWPADPVAQFTTNLATLKALVAPGASPLTLTLQPYGTTCEAVLDSLEVEMQAEFLATVVINFKLIEGTL
jgi:hypothetical protein